MGRRSSDGGVAVQIGDPVSECQDRADGRHSRCIQRVFITASDMAL